MNSHKSAQIIERASQLLDEDPKFQMAYLAALQEEMLNKLDVISAQLTLIASQSSKQEAAIPTLAPAESKPTEYEYTSVTIRTGALFSEDKAVNNKVREMASQGWELVSNTEARGTILGPPGRMLQFRRPKRRR